ncbi:MAG: hypothetical protein WC391_08595 [Methanoregula sp.]
MKCPYILLAFSALICCALFAGCTSPSEVAITPVETTGPQTATTAAVTSPPTPITTLDLVVTLPPEQFVDLQLTKDRRTERSTCSTTGVWEKVMSSQSAWSSPSLTAPSSTGSWMPDRNPGAAMK